MAKTFQWIKDHSAFIAGSGKAYINCDGCGKCKLILRSVLRRKVNSNHKGFHCSRKCLLASNKVTNTKYILVDGKKQRACVCDFCKSQIFIPAAGFTNKERHFCGRECRVKYFISKNELGKMFDVVIKDALLEIINKGEEEMEVEHT